MAEHGSALEPMGLGDRGDGTACRLVRRYDAPGTAETS
jgi:hypothetical protein